MNNWQYALFTPTGPWRGAMTLPREVSLARKGDEIVLVQKPVPELEILRHCLLLEGKDVPLRGEWDLPVETEGNTLEILVTMEPGSADEVGFRVLLENGKATTIGYDVLHEKLFIDRSRSGEFFNENLSPRQSAPLGPIGGILELRILVDTSSVEVFADRGRVVLTDLVFPGPEQQGVQLYSAGGSGTLRSLKIFSLNTVWPASQQD